MAAASRKRPCRDAVPEPVSIEMMPLAARLSEPVQCSNDWVYDSDVRADRLALIQKLWTGDFAGCVGALAKQHPVLHASLRACVANTYKPRDAAKYDAEQELRLDAVLRNLMRTKSQKKVPLWTAAHSVAAMRYQLPGPLWAMFATESRGLLMSSSWTKQLIRDAREWRPEATEPLIQGVSCICFDNYTRRCLYKSQVSAGEGGYSLDMTNWGELRVPARLAPASLDAQEAFQNLYRTDLSLRHFVSGFAWNNADVVANKQDRFVAFLKAAASGQLLQRPNTKPTWRAEFEWQTPMWGVLQSSNADVEFEIDTMRAYASSRGVSVLLVACDGLGIHRVNHLLGRKPEKYLEQKPAVVPIVGESPHGLHQFLHACHRGFAPFLLKCAQEIGNPAIIDDPAAVKHHNSHLYFHWVVIRAAAEYIYELSRGPGGADFEDVPAFVRACEANVDLSWVVHYLYDAGFLMLQFKQAVRALRNETMDLCWREFVTIARTSNKTMYGPLAIMQVYRAVALHPDMAALLRNIRCIPMSSHAGACVGLDTPCEWLHYDLTTSLTARVTEISIEEFIKDQPFLHTTTNGMRTALGTEKHDDVAKLKAMDADVATLKSMFRTKIGATWVQASRARTSSKLLSGTGARQTRPWKQYEKVHNQKGDDSTFAYVRRHLMTLAFSHVWQL